jgi:hypothetical protein
MADSQHHAEDASQLFLVRLWEEHGNEQAAPDPPGLSGATDTERHLICFARGSRWKGRIQHVTSGRAENFTGSCALVELLAEMMDGPGTGD